MELVLMLILIAVAALSFVPVIKMNGVRDDFKYQCLRYLVNAAFAWTVLVCLERTVDNMQIVYYVHMLGYPMKFLLAAFTICTITDYTESKMPKWLTIILIVGFVVELTNAFTNQMTHFLLNIDVANITSLEILYAAPKGWYFVYHLVVLYCMLLFSVAYLFYFFYKHRDVRHYRSISITMGISVAVVLLFNLAQLLVVQTTIDLTYVSIILVTYSLYQVIFKKDMIYNLKASGRGEILSNMREIYIITDEQKNIVDISPLLLDKYELKKSDYIGKVFDVLLEDLRKFIVIYVDYDVDEQESNDKDHYHLREKQFHLRGFKESGHMILLYDETQVYRLLQELNRLSYYDYMTGLHNRNFMENKLEHITSTKDLGIVSLDLNGLKANNDYLGHDRGDYLLKQLANQMKKVADQLPNHYMARIGGDEFLIVIEHSTKEQLIRIKSELLELCDNKDISKQISVSIGIAFSEEENNVYKLIRDADEDMYKMKQQVSKEYQMAIVEYAKKSGQYIR